MEHTPKKHQSVHNYDDGDRVVLPNHLRHAIKRKRKTYVKALNCTPVQKDKDFKG